MLMWGMTLETASEPIATPAATMVICCQNPDGGAPLLLMVERIKAMAFAGGAAVFPGGPPSVDYHHRYGEIQLFDVWNQHKNEMRIIQATCQGVDLDKTLTVSGDTLPFPVHLISKWLLSDVSVHTLNKMFILLHFILYYYFTIQINI